VVGTAGGDPFLEVWAQGRREVIPLNADRVTIGRSTSSDVTVADATVSRLHAVLERYPGGWSVRDVGSANGTFVNGARVLGETRLQPGDEITVGVARLSFRAFGVEPASETIGTDGPPVLTRRERDVLLALCRPLVGATAFPEVPTIRELAAQFVVSEAAIKQHLLNLYDKFGISTRGESRRIRLANEALRRRAVTLGELRDDKA